MLVLPEGVRTNRPVRTPDLHCSILADNVVVSDTRPSMRLVTCINFCRREIIIRRIACVVDDDHVGHTPCRELVVVDIKIGLPQRYSFHCYPPSFLRTGLGCRSRRGR